MCSNINNKKQQRIALLVDNPQRDLPGLCLVARAIARKGAICFLVPMNLRTSEIWALAPDLVLINHLRTIYENWVEELLKANILIGILDTEGNVFGTVPSNAIINKTKSSQSTGKRLPALEQHALSMTRNPEIRRQVACYCVWTPSFADYANKARWYENKQMFITGTPRADFYSPCWHKASLRISPHFTRESEKIILVATNFPLANPRFATPKKEVKNLTSLYNYDADFVRKCESTQLNALKGLIELVTQLSDAFPDQTIVCRPHPFENDNIYIESFKSCFHNA